MRVMVLNGMHAGDELAQSLQGLLVGRLQARGWEVETFLLHEMRIEPCIGCFGCWVRTPGRCVMPGADEIARAYVRSDLVVFLTPVTFGGYSSELKKAVDHLIGALLPFFEAVDGETHHGRRYDRYPNLLALGLLPQRDEESESIFRHLVERNAINMWAPAWAAGTLSRRQSDTALLSEIETLLVGVGVA